MILMMILIVIFTSTSTLLWDEIKVKSLSLTFVIFSPFRGRKIVSRGDSLNYKYWSYWRPVSALAEAAEEQYPVEC